MSTALEVMKLIVDCLQTFLTSISLSAIATNGVVQSTFLFFKSAFLIYDPKFQF